MKIRKILFTGFLGFCGNALAQQPGAWPGTMSQGQMPPPGYAQAGGPGGLQGPGMPLYPGTPPFNPGGPQMMPPPSMGEQPPYPSTGIAACATGRNERTNLDAPGMQGGNYGPSHN